MKVGIVGTGAVGTSCMMAMALRGSAHDIILVNRNHERACGAVADLQYGAVHAPVTSLRAGHYEDLGGASVVFITAGANEQSGDVFMPALAEDEARSLDDSAATL